MSAALLDGKQLAQTMRAEIAGRIAEFARVHQRRPGLAAVIVGDDPGSQIYVRNKRKACQEVGMESWLHALPADTTQPKLLELVDRLNADPAVDGILVQLPLPKLPKQVSEEDIIRAVSPLKDVDGFCPEN